MISFNPLIGFTPLADPKYYEPIVTEEECMRQIGDMLDQVIYELVEAKKNLVCNERELLAHHVERGLKQLKEVDIEVFHVSRASGVPYAVCMEDDLK